MSSLDPASIQFGLDTFGDITVDNAGRQVSHAQQLRYVLDEAILADQVGLDAFGVGGHARFPSAVVELPAGHAARRAHAEERRVEHERH